MAIEYVSLTFPPNRPSGNWEDYEWIVITGALASFFMSWGIGANDVANSFATSVGSKTLSMWQAVIIAGIFEFAGAVGLGSETAKTVAADIANTSKFVTVPEMYMYGMLCALTIAGTWLFVATYYKLPVSTTHSIIGAIMGFGLVYGGGNGVLWHQEKGDFPYTKGLLPVVLSWFFSPLVGGILAAIFFSLSKFIILRRQNSSKWAIWSLPILLFLTFFINLMFVLAKGAGNRMKKTWPCTKKKGMHGLTYDDCSDMYSAACWISAIAAAGVAIVGSLLGIPYLTRRLNREVEAEKEAAESGSKEGVEIAVDAEPEEFFADGKIPLPPLYWQKPESGMMLPLWFMAYPFMFMWRQIVFGLFYDVHDPRIRTDKSKELEAAAEQYDPHTERVYEFLQVISACCVAFAHGSNDVANSVGPFSAIFFTYENWKIPGSSTAAPKWIFVFGGVGIVFGLLMYGYNIIRELGCNLLHLTPSRGFSAELAAGLTISLSSFFGIPVSTTQIITGAELGVGLCEGRLSGVNWWMFGKTFSGWVLTIILNLAFCACLFSMGAYAPSIHQSDQIGQMRVALMQFNMENIKATNATNTKWASQEPWWTGSVAKPMIWNGSRLMPQLNKTYYTMKGLVSPKEYIMVDTMLYYNAYSNQLIQNYSITAIGQNDKNSVTSGAVPYKPQP